MSPIAHWKRKLFSLSLICNAVILGWHCTTFLSVFDKSNDPASLSSAGSECSPRNTRVDELKVRLSRAHEKIAALEKALAAKFFTTNNTNKTQMEQLGEAEERVRELEKILKRHNLEWTMDQRQVPAYRILGRTLDFPHMHQLMEEQMTVVLFSLDETEECLQHRLDLIVHEYPKIKILVLSSANSGKLTTHNVEIVPDVVKEGKALEIMASKLTTNYFLFLSSGTEIFPHKSDQGVSWLFHALQEVPELDFVGGGILHHETGVKYPVLEIPCYRLRLCNWTLSQSFEYRYSVDDMMICEETSSSFMGHALSLKKVGQFDPDLEAMATTDFFLRAKGKAVVGLRPEVRFLLHKSCKLAVLTRKAEADRKLPLMRKYQLYIIRDSLGREVLASDSKDYSSLKYGIVHWKDHTFATPFYNRGLLLSLVVGVDYLESKNITYFISGGVALGGLKMRGILPWDRDIDIGFFGNPNELQQGLREFCKVKNIKATFRSELLDHGTTEVWLYADDSGAYSTMFEQKNKPYDQFMYLNIHGLHYPVYQNIFHTMRTYYGIRYLQMHVDPKAKMMCSKNGHHACIPEEFSNGGGHWRDFYCDL